MSHSHVLIVEDERAVSRLLSSYISEMGMTPVVANNGLDAKEILNQGKVEIKAVLLDRMLPRMNGMELLSYMKADHEFRFIPVILQTALTSKQDIVEGIKAGAFYYLTKPYEKSVLNSVVIAAVGDYERHFDLRVKVRQGASILGLIQKAEYRIQNLEQAEILASSLSSLFPDSSRTAIGLHELLINAIEHGNLGISYDEKGELNQASKWKEEVNKRLELAEYMSRFVTVNIERNQKEITVSIQDQGEGFYWQDYLELDPSRAQDNHGRGIALARHISFDNVEFEGNGNKVTASVKI